VDIDKVTYKINGAIYEVNRVPGSGFLENVHEAQLLNYLRATNYKVGLLVNFSHDNAKIKRFVL